MKDLLRLTWIVSFLVFPLINLSCGSDNVQDNTVSSSGEKTGQESAGKKDGGKEEADDDDDGEDKDDDD